MHPARLSRQAGAVARPEKVLQFGEGNFLRAFADWMIDLANRRGLFQGSIVVCQPRAREAALADLINAQGGVYTLVMRGRENGRVKEKIETITAISRCLNCYRDYDELLQLAASPELRVIISNTTEAGLAYGPGDQADDRPPASFPAKLTAFLRRRWAALGESEAAEMLVLPTELIDANGAVLKGLVQRYAEEWRLGPAFGAWLERRIHFADTLVDRIVTGRPSNGEMAAFQDQLGARDELLVASELYNLWVIQGPREWSEFLPIDRTEAQVIWTDDVAPYKKRKVRILNGAHTAAVPAAFLAGYDLVREFMGDELIRRFLRETIRQEIIPTLNLPRPDLEAFADSVFDRFDNPYIDHRLLDIALNTSAKFRARCLPSILDYQELNGHVPERLAFSLAAYILFYRGRKRADKYFGRRADGREYEIRDDQAVLEFFAAAWAEARPEEVAARVLGRAELWDGRDLNQTPGLTEAVAGHLRNIAGGDLKAALAALMRP